LAKATFLSVEPVFRVEPLDGVAGSQLLGAFAGEMALRYTDERPMACGGVKRLDDATAEVKRLYVLPRGARARCRPPPPASLSRTLPSSWAVGTFVSTPAISTGCAGSLPLCGYREIHDYNGNPYATYWFEKTLG